MAITRRRFLKGSAASFAALSWPGASRGQGVDPVLVVLFLRGAADGLNLVVPHGDPDYYALQVIDSLLSGGASSRLPQHLREDLGLVYHVSSFYPTLAASSHFAIYAATAPHRLLAVKSAVLQALTRLIEEPVPPDELTRAKRYLLGSYALSHQRMKDQAYALAWYETLGLSGDFAEQYAAGLQAVTAADVQRAASAIFTRFALAVTMPRG